MYTCPNTYFNDEEQAVEATFNDKRARAERERGADTARLSSWAERGVEVRAAHLLRADENEREK